MDLSDKHLETLRKCLDGDDRSCDKLLIDPQVSLKINSIVKRYANDARQFRDWEDVAQEIRIKALNSLKNNQFTLGDKGISGFKAWLGNIAHHMSIDYFFRRKENREDSLDKTIPGTDNITLLETLSSETLETLDLLEHEEFTKRLKALYAEFKKKVKKINSQYPKKEYLKIWEEWKEKKKTQNQIAKELNIGQGTVSRHTDTLRTKLLLEEEEFVARLAEALDITPKKLEQIYESLNRKRSKEHWDDEDEN